MNARMAIAAVLAMATIGEVFVYLSPLLLGSVVDSFSLREGTAGILVALEIAASSLSAVLVSAVLYKIPIRLTGFISILIVILGDLTSAFVGSIEIFVGLRVLAALGAGALFALANALAAGTRSPEKSFALIGVSVVLAATLGFMFLTFAIEQYGPQSAFAALAILTSLGLPFVWWLPRTAGKPKADHGVAMRALARGTTAIMLTSVLLLYVGQYAVWVYVERIGVEIGLPLAEISTILVINGFLALAGPVLVHRLDVKYGRLLPIAAAMIIQIVTVLALVHSLGSLSYASSVIILSLAYTFVIPYFRGVMASLDPSGRVVGASAAFVTIGAAAGPAFGGIVLNVGGTYAQLGWISAGLFALTLVMVAPITRWADRRDANARR